MAGHPPPVIAPVFATPLQAEGKLSHFAGARGLWAEGGGPPTAVPSNMLQPPSAAPAAPAAPNAPCFPQPAQHYMSGGTAPCSSPFNMVQGMPPATRPHDRLHEWTWAEVMAEGAASSAVHAQPLRPCCQQVGLGAEAIPMPQALPAAHGMTSAGVQGLQAHLPQVPLPTPRGPPASVPACAAAPSRTAPGLQEGIQRVPVVQAASPANAPGVTASTLPGATPSAHAIPARAAGAETTGAQTKGRRTSRTDAAAVVIPEGTLRSPEVATAGCDFTNVPDGFPMGPILGDVEDLKNRVNYYTSDPRTGEGAFGVCRTRQVRHSKNKGNTCYLECYRHKKDSCKWKCLWEHTTEGWVLLNYLPHCFEATDEGGNVLQNMPSVPAANGHCHALLQDEARVRARILCMRLPLARSTVFLS